MSRDNLKRDIKASLWAMRPEDWGSERHRALQAELDQIRDEERDERDQAE